MRKVCRHLAASIAAGTYWRIGEDCFKQENRADGFSVVLFYSEEEWWITSNPVFPDFDSPLLAHARPPSNSSYMQLDWLEWQCRVWEDDAKPSTWIKSIYTSSEEQRLQQVAESITLSEQQQAVCVCLAFVICTCLARKQHYARQALER